jgi:hypothetical protein
MRRELHHVSHPWRTRLSWAGIYIVLLGIISFALYQVIGRVQTYNLPVGSIQLTVPYSTYLVGETVSFTVKNNFNSPVYVSNACPAEPLSVYRYETNKWVRIHDTTALTNCENQPRNVMIPANSSMTATFANWPNLFNTPGKYRVAMQVQYYNALPYQDFEVITPPPVAKPVAPTRTPSREQSDDNENTSYTTQTQTQTQTPTRTPQTYTVNVTSAGNYDVTSLSLYVGDSIQFVYQPPYNNEVQTNFTPQNGTTATVRSVTVDSEFHTRTRTFTAAGSWSFKAADHNGNSGIVTVH